MFIKNVLYMFMLFNAAILNGMEADDAVCELEHMLQGCVIEKPLVAPSNSPSLLSEQDMQEISEESTEMITCIDSKCLYSCVTRSELQSHMYTAHGLLICLCCKIFVDYDSYRRHTSFCQQ